MTSWVCTAVVSVALKVRTSPLEPRAILVQMPNGLEDEWPQQEQLYKRFDWAAIRKMVNP